MIIKKAEFIKSSSALKQCPDGEIPEFAFIGRSNVGKSSLINFLADRKNLAKTSVSPGKTRLINHFLVNESWFLVDLPGYGYAKVGKKEREKFNRLIYEYIGLREQLVCVFSLVDSRHEPHMNDLEFINWLGMNGIPLAIVFTKTDKLSRAEVNINIKNFKRQLLHAWEEVPVHFFTSVKDREGREEILSFIGDAVKNHQL